MSGLPGMMPRQSVKVPPRSMAMRIFEDFPFLTKGILCLWEVLIDKIVTGQEEKEMRFEMIFEALL
jgi:hypothetical protein